MLFAKFVSDKKGHFRFTVFLNFIVRKKVTFAKFISEKKGDFQFIVFLNFIAQKGQHLLNSSVIKKAIIGLLFFKISLQERG